MACMVWCDSVCIVPSLRRIETVKCVPPLNMSMANDVPAIVRDYSDNDRDATVISTPTDTVSFRRGFGDTGYRVEVVEHDCPQCTFDRMIRRHDIPRNEVRYWCLNPNCRYFVGDELSYACHGSYPQGPNPTEPVVHGRSQQNSNTQSVKERSD